MKLVKTSVIACGLSAFLAYPVIAQSLVTDAKARKGMQDSSIQSGMSDDEDSSPRLRPWGAKVGRKSTKGAKSAAGGNAQDKETVDESPTNSTPISGKRH
ncbi:hypothetical protein H8A97_35505 [Bradyrhizobium sp. Arg62]|uniref:hypothetical protein n=1 Tax=Bradyrhizobium brasilense TaxID=1419277 RepID=UPI001E5FBD8C|nr:hypothetical protein [Bradyrhizobium brasilense]MCC8950241.1 hypothetical protein [Bradyrhizobium brasilense]